MRMRRRLLIRAHGAASRKPLLWEVGKRCGVEWNVRRVRTRADMSEAAVELSGGERDVRRAMKLLKKRGAEVFPVERSLFE
jgi:hypothetical protein